LELPLTNNDVLRRIRYTFHLRDSKVVSIFAHANYQVSEQQVQSWLKKDDDPEMVELVDVELASFLNGFIIEKRGKREGEQPKSETTMTKNLMLMKLKIALQLQNDDIISLLATTGFTVGKSELTAFFRKPEHKNYRLCKSQFLRNFLQAIDEKFHVERKVSANKTVESTFQHKENKPAQSTYRPKEKPNESQSTQAATPKKHYVNPKATVKADEKRSSRRVLKLKPEDIYKNS